MTKPDFLTQFRAARASTVPLIAVRTYDNASATQRIIRSFKASTQESLPILVWDCINGLMGYNAVGKRTVASISGDNPLVHPVAALKACVQLPEDCLVFMANIHRFWADPSIKQMIWNQRDRFKATGTTLIMLIGPGVNLPEGLADDVLTIDDPLPTEKELSDLVKRLVELKEIKPLSDATITKAVDRLVGLPMFGAEQSTSMTLTDDGLDTDALWERKREMVEQTKGMTIWRGGERFADLGGGNNAKNYLTKYIKAVRPRAILFLDEIEKLFAGAGTENTGTKTGFLQKFLTWMQDNEVDGILAIGHPGCMKSALAKAMGNEADCPTIVMDLNGMQQKELGASEENLNRGLGIVDAIARGRVLVFATCNSMGTMPPEFKRRFTEGTFFFDLPSNEAREQIWAIYEAKYKVGGDRPDDEGWTGAEIKECCRKASRMHMTLIEASTYIVPISRSNADRVRQLRTEATGKYIDAENPGTYEHNEQATAMRTERKFRRTEAVSAR